MIKAILWDLDGTLLDFKKEEDYAIKACFEKFNLGKCDQSMLDKYSAINDTYWKRIEKNEVEKKVALVERFAEFFNFYNLDSSIASEFNAKYQIALGDVIYYFDTAYETIKYLKGRVIQLGVTNGTKIAQTRKVKLAKLDELFEGVYISEDIGFEKPSVEFFKPVFEFLDKKDIKRDEILIVGDSLTSDIKGGNNCNIKTCLFNPKGKSIDTDLRIDYQIKEIKDVLKIL